MNLENVRAFALPEVDHVYTWKDAALFALSLGFGSDPTDLTELPFVYEEDMVAVPAMANIIAHPPFWLNKPELELDWVKILHAEQGFVIHAPIPVSGKMRSTFRVASVEDKGADKGGILTLEKQLHDIETGMHHCTVTTSVFLRGDGGQGSFGTPPVAGGGKLPEGDPDQVIDIQTFPQMALLYRLNGDVNPLHADPAIAAAAGFRQPILHGLATMGVATRALLRGLCGNDPKRLTQMFVRFSSPVYPGETIRTEIFEGSGIARFRCRVLERNVLVLDRGFAAVSD
jgi:acyl dehydratase